MFCTVIRALNNLDMRKNFVRWNVLADLAYFEKKLTEIYAFKVYLSNNTALLIIHRSIKLQKEPAATMLVATCKEAPVSLSGIVPVTSKVLPVWFKNFSSE